MEKKTDNKNSIYKEIKRIINDAMNNEQLVLFVGAGVSVDAGIPLWKDAITKIANKMPLSNNQNDNLKIPQYYYNIHGKKEYNQLMRDVFKYGENLTPTKLHERILDFKANTIVTTNYDHLLERAAERRGEFIRVISQDIDMPYRKSNRELIKMHGDFEHDNFVLKEDDYLAYSRNFKLIETYIKSLIGSKVVLFIGYSLNDPDVKHVISWVKDILKDDFQRAYLILTKVESNSIEQEYFKNLGINLIYGSELYEDEAITHSEQLLKVLDYLLKKEEKNHLDAIYDELEPLRKLNYIYGKYISNIFRKIGGVCDSSDTIDLIDEKDSSRDHELREAIGNMAENQMCSEAFEQEKVYAIIDACKKSRFSKMLKREGRKRKEIKIDNQKESLIEQEIFNFDFQGLKEILKKNNPKLSSDNPELYMQQAYISAFLNDYYNAYNYLKLAAQIFYNQRNYIWYFIAELNRKYVGKNTISSFDVNIDDDERERLKSEVETIDLDKVLNTIPKIGMNDSCGFLQELKSFNISHELFYDAYADAMKTNEQAITRYLLFAGRPAYENLRVKIKDFERYETGNYIILDRFTENKSIFELYIRTILSSVNAFDITKENNGRKLGNIKPDFITNFDLYIIFRYIKQNDIRKIIKEYSIKEIPLSEEGYDYLHRVCKFICDGFRCETIGLDEIDRFWTYLELLGHIKISNEIVKTVFERLNAIENEFDFRTHLNVINDFIKNIFDQEIYREQESCEQAKKFLEKLIRFIILSGTKGNWGVGLLNNLLAFIDKGGLKFDDIKLIKELYEINSKDILVYIYPYLVENGKTFISEKYKEWKPEKGKATEYYQWCDAVLVDIKEANILMEEEIMDWILEEATKKIDKGNHPMVGKNQIDFCDVLNRLVNMFLEKKSKILIN